jgi:hypothetical protein
MGHKETINEIKECIDYGNFTVVDVLIDELLTDLSAFEASKQLSALILNEYTTFRSGHLAQLLEAIIRTRPELAQVNHPENFLFKLCVTTGSRDLYECYIEEAVVPFLEDKDDDEKSGYYIDLYATAMKLTDHFFPNYIQCIKGMDYNGAFSTLDNNENVMLINREDYEIMEGLVENFNRIVGRRDIVSDLEEKSN